MNDNSSRILEVGIDEILPNRNQPRRQFDDAEELELSDSIKKHGVIQPIVVRAVGDKYEIIAGERRYKASVLAGKETVPVIVKNLSDKDSAEIALIENIQRKNLSPIEEALSYKKRLDIGDITQEQLAVKLGKSQSSIANKIRLLNLSDEVQEALLENKISERHARSLLKLKTSKEQNEMLDRIINERLTVRKTDEEIDKLMNKEEKGVNEMNNNLDNNMFNPFAGAQQTNPADTFGFGPMPNAPTQPQAAPESMGAFGINPTSVEPAQPQVAPAPMGAFGIDSTPVEPAQSQVAPAPMGTFGINPTPVEPAQPQVASSPMETFGINPTSLEPTQPQVAPAPMGAFGTNPAPVEPAQPQVAPAPMGTFGIDPTPVEPAQSQVAPTPMGTFGIDSTPVEPAQSAPTDTYTFDENGVITGEPQTNETVPNLNPIIESSDTLNNSMTNNLYNQQPEAIKMPEPIIIADYNKQYDPVLPPNPQDVQPVVDFKEVINAIRECSSKIEQFGFRIDVEEYDLANSYKVIFNIEK